MKIKSNNTLAWSLVLIVAGMFAFGFALVPLYNVLCKIWDINGKTTNQAAQNSTVIDESRWVEVEFLATANNSLPWDFYPLTQKVKLHPGQNVLIYYVAKNKTAATMTVQAIPSVSPSNAAKYLKKTECFCFRQQTFTAGEKRDMPVLFHIDVNLPKEIQTVSLSYTLFDTAHLGHTIENKSSGKIP